MRHPLLGTLIPQQFLEQYWQKQPLLLKNTVNCNFWTLDANDIAGAALDEQVESRLIQHSGTTWHLAHGPFTEATLSNLPSANWTLLVQALDVWFPEARQLLNYADFLPSWRRDDLMVSIAAPGGGVGPHTDAYDVFLVQLSGTRTWRIAPPANDASPFEVCPDLWQVPPYEATEIYQCHPGDVLYLPPGWRHDGVADTLCITASIGFRAPSLVDLLVQLIGQIDDDFARFSDAGRAIQNSAEITQEDIARTRDVLTHLAQLDDETIAEALAAATTQPRADTPESHQQKPLKAYYESHPAARFAWFRASTSDIHVFVNGQMLTCPLPAHQWLDQWSSGQRIFIDPALLDSQLHQFLSTLLSIGCVYPVDNF